MLFVFPSDITVQLIQMANRIMAYQAVQMAERYMDLAVLIFVNRENLEL